ncbi:MAG: hypothetical protein AB8B99_07060 [Phormidesmis sp.]
MRLSQPSELSSLLLSEIFVSVSTTQTLTRSQREGLKQLLLEEALSEEEATSVDRILRGIRRGCIKVV